MRLICLIMLIATFSPVFAQQKLDWKQLATVKFEYLYSQAVKQWVSKPIFPPGIKALDGKLIEIEGYVLPLDTDGTEYALSSNPFVSCFFCGGAGPESVMELRFKNPKVKYKMDAYQRFKGTLKLATRDFEMAYTLEAAEESN